ncbi:hypothetical protein EIN_371940 [Entamoeba invadens IP1]|uniref:Uncharacterized protein n=1 Tax=Entamoeba invadens IP1 TaxID=370355 RepID=A0A0A1UGL0_ENTIV|nr:hypothetical protein EIN_371940 [Entamoeba invadens IP1]ELP92772.1 hypothetical protein EIN_371940 [Entamoeba invadens IP1]|eukprot:XP_004259543.1 hypothetical protein EIN_371940 [Entamoeba invadens IP1]
MNTQGKSLIFSGVTSWSSLYHFTSDIRVSKRIPETLIAQVGNLNTKSASWYYLTTKTCNILYQFLPIENNDVTYILISPNKENEKEMKRMIELSKLLIYFNGSDSTNAIGIPRRRNTLENFFQLYDRTPLYLLVPPHIPMFRTIVTNYMNCDTFPESIKQMSGFGIIVGGFFRPFVTYKQTPLSSDANTAIVVWANTLIKTFLADNEIGVDEYVENVTEEKQKTCGIESEPITSDDCNKQFVPNPQTMTISSSFCNMSLTVQKITNDMLVVGYSRVGEPNMIEFKDVLTRIFPILMMFRRELTYPAMTMTSPQNYRTAFPGMVHFVVIDYTKGWTFYPAFDPSNLEVLVRKFIIDCRAQEDRKIFVHDEKYIFAYEMTSHFDSKKERVVDYEAFGVFVRLMPFKLVNDYLASALQKYRDLYK